MAENDERLLSLIEPQADASMPKGFISGRLADAGIGLPIVEVVAARRGNKIVSVPAPQSLKVMRAAETLRWPVIERSPDGEIAWAAMSEEVHAEQERMRAAMAPKTATARPDSDAAISSRPMVRR